MGEINESTAFVHSDGSRLVLRIIFEGELEVRYVHDSEKNEIYVVIEKTIKWGRVENKKVLIEPLY